MPKNKLKVGIMGDGEVAKMIATFYDQPFVNDFPKGKTLDILHICLPYTEDFIETVSTAIATHAQQGIVIIHSSVPVGTTAIIRNICGPGGIGIIHSPVLRVDPDLETCLKTTRYIGADTAPAGEYAALAFNALGIPASILYKSSATELIDERFGDDALLTTIIKAHALR